MQRSTLHRAATGTLMALAALGGTASAQTPAPLDATQYFPLVNGAIYEYRNINVVSSSTARMTVTSGVTFNGASATEVSFVVSCDKTAGKETWNVPDQPARMFGVCRSRKLYFVQQADGLRELGDVVDHRDYAGALYPSGNQSYLRTSVYNNPAPPMIKNGHIPGVFAYNPGVPGVIPPSWQNSKPGEAWGGNVSQNATYTSPLDPRTRSGYENRRDVGVGLSAALPAGTFNKMLHVEDAILDVSSAFAPSQLRHQVWQYAKGVGPVVTRTGDMAYDNTINQLGLTENAPMIGSSRVAMEEFHLVRHNLQGCPGYDPNLPALPPNSGNICAAVYSSDPSLGSKLMVEFYNAAFNYYFITARKDEQDLLNKTPAAGFTRTGQSFYVAGAPGNGLVPLTRFFFAQIAKNGTRGSHFYTVFPDDVAALTALNPSNAQTPRLPYNEGVDGYVYPPTMANGKGVGCAPGQTPVYRVFRGNARFPDDPNHRFTVDAGVRDQFVAQGWDDEGVAFCGLPAPQ